MDDFLDGLRYDKNGENLKPAPRNNHSPIFKNSNRKNHSQKSPIQNQSRNQIPVDKASSFLLQDEIENLCSVVEILASKQNYLIDAQVKNVDVMERQGTVLHTILDQLSL